MTLVAFAAVATITLLQQPAPLVSQTELLPPPGVQQQAPGATFQSPAAQPAPQPGAQGQLVTQQQQATPLAPAPVKPAVVQPIPAKTDNKSGGGKRVVAFWVILPDSNK
jgi:hypothetical protein